MASSRPKRWFTPPPQRTAYFSRARRPGVVLRVSVMRARVPRTAWTYSAVRLATPDRWPSRFSATRSAARMARAFPRALASTVPGWTRSPSLAVASKVAEGSIAAMASRAHARPETTPVLRAAKLTLSSASGSTHARLVMSPARPRSSSRAARTTGSIRASGRGSIAVIRPRGARAAPPPAPGW